MPKGYIDYAPTMAQLNMQVTLSSFALTAMYACALLSLARLKPVLEDNPVLDAF